MPDGRTSQPVDSTLNLKLIAQLKMGCELITSLSDEVYRSPAGEGSVGAHFRHILDTVVTLLEGIGEGTIDYSNRERDLRIEIERQFAANAYARVVDRVRKLSAEILAQAVTVRSEGHDHLPLVSSVGREIEYVHSHTIHHFALIREKLATTRTTVPIELGVAPSTIEYRKSLTNQAATS